MAGAMTDRMRRSFAGLEASSVAEGTRLRGTVPDEAALHSLLVRCRDLHLELVSVRSGAPRPAAGEATA